MTLESCLAYLEVEELAVEQGTSEKYFSVCMQGTGYLDMYAADPVCVVTCVLRQLSMP